MYTLKYFWFQNEVGLRAEGLQFFNSDTMNEIEDECEWIKDYPNCRSVESRKYRSFDGSCNNLNEPNFGRAFTPFSRLMDSSYAPGSVGLPRKAQDGSDLPSARLVSTTG